MMKVALVLVVVPKRRVCSAAQHMYIEKRDIENEQGNQEYKQKAWVKMRTSNGVTVSVYEGQNGDKGED